jgi:hypothetical protein
LVYANSGAHSLPPGQTTTQQVACPSGLFAVGGGVQGANITVNSSDQLGLPEWPSDPGSGWTATVTNTGGADTNVPTRCDLHAPDRCLRECFWVDGQAHDSDRSPASPRALASETTYPRGIGMDSIGRCIAIAERRDEDLHDSSRRSYSANARPKRSRPSRRRTRQALERSPALEESRGIVQIGEGFL